ncbi:hypothetical protein MMC25_002169 [Agyrium rufum]|nr:hypothetical protein [Agyrium rufum]
MVDRSSFESTIWTFTTIGTLLTIGRFYIRYFKLKALFWDDFWHLIAYVLHLASSIALTIQAKLFFEVLAIKSGEAPRPEPDVFLNLGSTSLHYNFALSIIFWLCLYAVKASFLSLYYLILRGSGARMLLWKNVAGFTFASFWICVSSIFVECGPHLSDQLKPEVCFTPETSHRQNKLILATTIFNCTSDILIMALPIPMLYQLRLRTSQKIAVAGVFMLAWVTIAFDILRTVESFLLGSQNVLLYTSLETEIAVIVSALPAYRILLKSWSFQRLKNTLLPGGIINHSHRGPAGTGAYPMQQGHSAEEIISARVHSNLRKPFDAVWDSHDEELR